MRRDTDTTHWNKTSSDGKTPELNINAGFENFVDSTASFSSSEKDQSGKIPAAAAPEPPRGEYAFGGPEDEPKSAKPKSTPQKPEGQVAAQQVEKQKKAKPAARQRPPVKSFHQRVGGEITKEEDTMEEPERPVVFESVIVEGIEEFVPGTKMEDPIEENPAPADDLDLTLDASFQEIVDVVTGQMKEKKNDATSAEENDREASDEAIEGIVVQNHLPARLQDVRKENASDQQQDVTHFESSVSSGGRTGGGRLGDRLIAKGLITDHQLSVALQEKKLSGKMLGQVLVDLAFISESQLSEILAEAAGFEVFDAKNTIVDGDALALLPKDMAMKLQVLPVSISGQTIILAMADPHDVVAMDKLRRHLPKNLIIKPLVTTPSVLSEAIDAAYGYSSDVAAILTEMENLTTEDLTKIPENEAYTHPVVRLVNALVFEAVKMGVSDLHWEPEENFIRLRYRLDGVLFTTQIIHKKHWSPISQRIKIMANMNIADKLTPQDGRFELKVGSRSADFRVSSLPTVWGENIVMRVLDKTASILPLEKLGFSPGNLEKIKFSQSRPEGIIIVTGPTGSGKSTSLYSMINAINNVEVNIQTLEDPVEYSLPMIRQTPVREGSLEFADGIRAMLRQDPDIIFIGEIRDGVTAEMALKAAMTGHQVYTTLHTNDSFSAIPRLVDLGLKPGMIAGAVIAIFAQRLARRLCPNCRVAYQPDEEECKHLGVDPANPPAIYKPKQGGCGQCRGQGYKGRIALAEILTLDEELDEIIARGGSKVELRRRAVEKGFKSMKDDAILKILDGVTSFESAKSCVDFSR